MTIISRLAGLTIAATLTTSVCLLAQGARPAAVAVPTVTGPTPATAGSTPFLAADRNLAPVDLKAHGYVEEEFVVRGTANVYDWADDGALTVKTPDVPYGTRILVRRPADPARFSGDVVVELLNTVRRFDWAWMWGYSHDYFLEHGDAWVGISMPAASPALKQFDATRYRAVSFANAAATPCSARGSNGAAAAAPAFDDSLKWDAISQVGALLKSGGAGRPLAGLRVAAVYLTTGQSPDLMTYINAMHAHAKLANGKPVYDGYLVKQPANPSRISQCAPALKADDARQAIAKLDVPIVAVFAQAEVPAGLPWRRADSDAPGDRFRLYEIAGGSHIEWAPYTGLPSFEDQTTAGIKPAGTRDWPIAGRCDPDIPLDEVPIMTHAFDAAFANLEQWVRKGTAPPRAPRLEVKDAGTPQASVATDQFGNGVGGVRSSYVDAPNATYLTTSPGPGTCRELGHMEEFDPARFKELYGSAAGYAAKVSSSVDRLVKARWLTPADGTAIKARLASTAGGR
jgi:hypothetical protein